MPDARVFGEIIAGDHALEFKERGYKTEVGTPNGKPVESKFIGNTIQICPVGALTSQVYRFRARPWDNKATASTCTLCPVGCSKIIDSRDGEIMRTRSMENPAVNDIWLCDKGWFGYEYVAHPDRLQKPLIRRNGVLEEATYEEAFDLIVAKLKQAKANQKIAAFGGNTLTVEENFLYQKLFRSGFGVNHLDHRIGEPLFSVEQEGMQAGMEISIGDCEQLSHIWLLGCDVTEEFPVLWLRLKQAINHGAKMGYIGHFEPEIARYLSDVIIHEPGKELEILKCQLDTLAKNHVNKHQCALFVGTQYLRSPQRGLILKLLSQFQEAFSINIMEGRGNSLGARFAGMRPDILPGGWPNKAPGFNALEVLQETCREGWDVLFVAGANPVLKISLFAMEKSARKFRFFSRSGFVLNETAQDADVVLPALTYVEKWGSFITIEGRIQKLKAGKEVPETIFSDGEIFSLLAQKLAIPLEVDRDFAAKLKSEKIMITRANFGEINEVNLSLNASGLKASFSYHLFDQGVRMEHNSHVRELAKEPCARIHPQEAEKRQMTDGDICTLQSGEQKIHVKIKVDIGVAENTIVLPLGFKNFPVHDLSNQLFNGLEIAIQRGA